MDPIFSPAVKILLLIYFLIGKLMFYIFWANLGTNSFLNAKKQDGEKVLKVND